jgi:hypothetical protein
LKSCSSGSAPYPWSRSPMIRLPRTSNLDLGIQSAFRLYCPDETSPRICQVLSLARGVYMALGKGLLRAVQLRFERPPAGLLRCGVGSRIRHVLFRYVLKIQMWTTG